MEISMEIKAFCEKTDPLNEKLATWEEKETILLGRELTDIEYDAEFRQVYKGAGFEFDTNGMLALQIKR